MNSTLDAALTAAKARIPLAHVETGLRSFDRAMPEEGNEVVVDRLCDLLLTPSADVDENFRREGVPPEHIFRVGAVMTGTVPKNLPVALPTLLRGEQALNQVRFTASNPHRFTMCCGRMRAPKRVSAICRADRLTRPEQQQPALGRRGIQRKQIHNATPASISSPPKPSSRPGPKP